MLEILAPCRGPDTVGAALKYGADSVYLGSKDFSARRRAKNFSIEEIKSATDECHSHGVKVYLALNTLVFDDEILKLIQTVDSCVNAGIDAVIVQDLGVMRVVKDRYPGLPLHASTQMTVTSIMGARILKDLGFKRVVLARELSFAEIRDIARSEDIEIEVFVHGALCVCLSGQCYMSAMLGGRSGNRGLCAQPCRLPFKDKKHPLSLKDLSIISKIRELEKIGVKSVKIEGRMKSSEYVGAAVNACRLARDGKSPDIRQLKDIFSRDGFTSGYYDNNYNNMGGTRRVKEKNVQRKTR
ncbi:MAG: U32 family peptidase [Eubacterium sp.]|jgi:putative protease|nr:U32 family peptidase [Eubacterium sp.]